MTEENRYHLNRGGNIMRGLSEGERRDAFRYVQFQKVFQAVQETFDQIDQENPFSLDIHRHKEEICEDATEKYVYFNMHDSSVTFAQNIKKLLKETLLEYQKSKESNYILED